MTDLDTAAGHPIYPGGPPCNPNCPGEHSMYHDGYADGYENAEAAAPAATIKWCDCLEPAGWHTHDSDFHPEAAAPAPMRPDWTMAEGTGPVPIEQAGYLPQAAAPAGLDVYNLLARWINHDRDCMGRFGGDNKCTCGLNDAHARLAAGVTGEGES